MTDERNTCALTVYPIVSRLVEISLSAVIYAKPPLTLRSKSVAHLFLLQLLKPPEFTTNVASSCCVLLALVCAASPLASSTACC